MFSVAPTLGMANDTAVPIKPSGQVQERKPPSSTTRTPIWRNAESREEICIGSVEELYNEIEKAVAAGVMTENPLKAKGFVPGNYDKANYDLIDLHRPYVDNIKLVSESGKVLTRELDLIDVWLSLIHI